MTDILAKLRAEWNRFVRWFKGQEIQPVKPPEPEPNEQEPVVIPPTNGIVYNDGAKATDKQIGGEIWMANWNRMNIRLYANAGEAKAAGVRSTGPWYPIAHEVMPGDAIILYKTVQGCEITARDFTSRASGQKYRFEGFFVDGLGKIFVRTAILKLTDEQMHGAVLACWGTIK
jgi:hypothetical protein